MSCESNRPSQAAGSFPAVARRACGLRRARTPWYNRIGMSSEGVRLLRLQLKLAPQLQARGGWRGPLAAQLGGAAFDLAQAIIDRAAYLATEGARDEQSLLNTCSPARGAVLLHWLLLGSGRGAAAPGDNASRRAQVEARLQTLASACAAVLQAQPMTLRVNAPANVFGDIHGQFGDLLLLLGKFGFPSHKSGDVQSTSYVFDGDWVDRGPPPTRGEVTEM